MPSWFGVSLHLLRWRSEESGTLNQKGICVLKNDKPTLTLYELTHISMLLPDPETFNDDEYRLNYRYDIERSTELAFTRARFSDRATWIFTGNVLLPPIFSVELEQG